MPDDDHGFFDYLIFEKTSGTEEPSSGGSSGSSSHSGRNTIKHSSQKRQPTQTQTNTSGEGAGCVTVFVILAVIYIIVKLAVG